MADVVYTPSLFRPLVSTLLALTQPHTTLLLGYETRHERESEFFRLLRQYYELRHVDSSLCEMKGERSSHMTQSPYFHERYSFSVNVPLALDMTLSHLMWQEALLHAMTPEFSPCISSLPLHLSLLCSILSTTG
jgi:hypothetical protein